MDIKCPRCQTVYHADPQHVGSSLRCYQCGKIFTIQDGTGKLRFRSGSPSESIDQPRTIIVKTKRRTNRRILAGVAAAAFAVGALAVFGILKPNREKAQNAKTGDIFDRVAETKNASHGVAPLTDLSDGIVSSNPNAGFGGKTAPVPPLSVDDFAARVKAKYPEYADMDNAELAQKIVAKYPEYQSSVSFQSPAPKAEHKAKARKASAVEDQWAALGTEPDTPARPIRRLENGTRITPDVISSGAHGILTLINGNAFDMVLKVVPSGTNFALRWVYVRRHNQISLPAIASGNYDLKYCSGEDWDSAGVIIRYGSGSTPANSTKRPHGFLDRDIE